MPLPGGQIVKGPVAAVAPALLVLTSGVGGEQNAAGVQGGVQLPQHPWQFHTGHMEQRRIGKDAVETLLGQVELQKVLLPDLAAAVGTGHGGERFGAIQANGEVTQFGEGLQVAPWSAAQVENREGLGGFNGLQQGVDVLANIVVARAFPEGLSALAVIGQGPLGHVGKTLSLVGHGDGDIMVALQTQEPFIMTISMYAASVPVAIHTLTSLSKILSKAAAHCEARKIDPQAFLTARLFPDMFPLIRQVQIAGDMVKGGVSRLAGVEVPKYEDNEVTFADLQARLAKTIAYLQTFKPEQIDGSEDRDILIPMRDRTVEMKGLPYLMGSVLPNMYFHTTTAYNLLRQGGVEIGKKDFLGTA